MEENNDSIKEVLSKEVSKLSQTDIPDAVKEKIKQIQDEFEKLIPELAEEYNFEIPFKVIQEKTGYEYEVISDVLLNMIMNKRIIGFINDQGTEGISDDILIVRKDHYYKSLEKDYETG